MLAALIGLTSYVLPSTPFGAQQQLAAASSRSAASCVRCQETSVEITPPAMESKVGFDYVPLLTALQAAEFREADFITRDALIEIAGPEAVKRGYVYFTEVPKLPVEDMSTIERLWRTYSDGKFGYAVQAKAFESKKVDKDFDKFFERIGWKNKEGSLLRWLPEVKADEFIYDLDKAPKGHLPLTSALRGTQLLKNLLSHPAWEEEEFKDVSF